MPQTKTPPPDQEKLDHLLDLLKEWRRRKKDNPLSFYIPLTHQDEAHRSLARERAFIGANRSGKTEWNVVEVLYHALGIHPHRKDIPVPNFGWVISVSNEAQREILQPKFLKYLPKDQIQKIRYRQRGVWDQIILKNQSIVGFKSCEMSREVFQGAALHYACFDEEPDKDVYDEVKLRLTDHAGSCWISMTPINGMSWTFDQYVDPESKIEDSEVFTASMWDNSKGRGGHIADEEVARREREIADPIMLRIRIYGEYHAQVGRIYKAFEKKIHSIAELPKRFWNEDGTISTGYDTYVAIDTGRCFAAGFYLIDYFGNIYHFDEYYAEDKTIAEHARTILNMTKSYGLYPDYVIDPSSQFWHDLAEHGIVCQMADNEVEKGIQATQAYLHVDKAKKMGPQYNNPSFYVVGHRCKRLLWEIQRYQWEPPSKTGASIGEKKNKPRKKDDHCVDQLRYLCVMHPQASLPPKGQEDERPLASRIMDRVKAKMKEKREGDVQRRTGDPWGLG